MELTVREGTHLLLGAYRTPSTAHVLPWLRATCELTVVFLHVLQVPGSIIPCMWCAMYSTECRPAVTFS